jgi:hypothetical protein
MSRSSRRAASALLPLLVAAGLAVPGGAVAKGADASTPPPPTAPTVMCDWSLDGPTDDGLGYVFSNQANDAGCIRVVQRDLTLRLYSIQLTPGWTYEVKKNGEGTDSTVLVRFSNPTTGGSVEARIEFGKTSIR